MKKLLFLLAVVAAVVAAGAKDDIKRYLDMRRM